MMRVADFVENCLAYEQYAFSWDEVKVKIPKTDVALRHELGRLSKKKEILALRQGFYLILPPRYKGFGKLPLEFYVEELFKFLDKPYYIAFFSAAAFHGASHQQVQQSYLMTKIPNLRDIKKGNIYLSISATSKWPNKNIQLRKSDAGIFNISSPALTAIDLIHYQSKMGGLNRILAILEELAESMTPEDIQELLQWYPHTSSIQRLGYLFQELQSDRVLLDPLEKYFIGKNYFPVLLCPDKDKKPGRVDNMWKVVRNIKLESDL
ncbi:type IV toxin-antitoxin system AbiEi family antitoxin domain-containing protein [Arthrospiribacter ruber]|nr:type IV toxin-antitoxin system AbiEi family antitoxin [Arthrospiribacter ruber]